MPLRPFGRWLVEQELVRKCPFEAQRTTGRRCRGQVQSTQDEAKRCPDCAIDEVNRGCDVSGRCVNAADGAAPRRDHSAPGARCGLRGTRLRVRQAIRAFFNLSRSLAALGRDFCVVGSEVPLQVGGRDFAFDLLFPIGDSPASSPSSSSSASLNPSTSAS